MSRAGTDSSGGKRRRSTLEFSRSTEIGLRLLCLFSNERTLLGNGELARLSRVSRSSTHRYAQTFVELGYLQQDPSSRGYMLGPKAADPGLSVIKAMRLALPVEPVLQELRGKTGYTVSLGVLDGTRVTYLHRLFAHRRGQHAIDLELHAGTSVPLHCTALGKALLASLTDSARREAIARIGLLVPYGPRSIVAPERLLAEIEKLDVLEPVVSDEELVEGARSIAMYVPRPHHEHAIAIDVTVPSADLSVTRLRKRLGPHIKEAAKQIARTAPAQPRIG